MITEITIKNYKSLENVTLKPGPLTVLVGANGSGKSNILDALMFLKGLVALNQGLDKVLEPRGGYEAVVWGRDIERDISVGLEWKSIDNFGQLSYSIRFGQSDGRGAVKEEFLLADSSEVLGRTTPNTYSFERGSSDTASYRSSLEEAHHYVPQTAEIIRRMRGWVFYNFDFNQMRPPHSVRSEFRLNETGNNLSTVLHALFSIESPLFDDIFDSVRGSVPVVEKLLSPIVGDAQTQVALKERDIPEPVAAWGLSDGTLFALALSTALLTPQIPTLLTLESPDASLHPYVMEHVAELLKSASRKTQVIVTTHSPYLLDHVPPQSIVVVEKIKGKTVLKPVKGRKGVRYAIDKLGAGKAWYSGHLGGVP